MEYRIRSWGNSAHPAGTMQRRMGQGVKVTLRPVMQNVGLGLIQPPVLAQQ